MLNSPLQSNSMVVAIARSDVQNHSECSREIFRFLPLCQDGTDISTRHGLQGQDVAWLAFSELIAWRPTQDLPIRPKRVAVPVCSSSRHDVGYVGGGGRAGPYETTPNNDGPIHPECHRMVLSRRNLLSACLQSRRNLALPRCVVAPCLDGPIPTQKEEVIGQRRDCLDATERIREQALSIAVVSPGPDIADREIDHGTCRSSVGIRCGLAGTCPRDRLRRSQFPRLAYRNPSHYPEGQAEHRQPAIEVRLAAGLPLRRSRAPSCLGELRELAAAGGYAGRAPRPSQQVRSTARRRRSSQTANTSPEALLLGEAEA